jgi:hypothetical protein
MQRLEVSVATSGFVAYFVGFAAMCLLILLAILVSWCAWSAGVLALTTAAQLKKVRYSWVGSMRQDSEICNFVSDAVAA